MSRMVIDDDMQSLYMMKQHNVLHWSDVCEYTVSFKVE